MHQKCSAGKVRVPLNGGSFLTMRRTAGGACADLMMRKFDDRECDADAGNSYQPRLSEFAGFIEVLVLSNWLCTCTSRISSRYCISSMSTQNPQGVVSGKRSRSALMVAIACVRVLCFTMKNYTGMSVTTKRAATVSEPDERKLEAHIQQPAHAPEGAVRAAQFTDENKQSQWNKATESYRTSSLDSATMIALSDDMIAKLKRDGNYQKFELYDPEAPGNGSAQDTGTVIEYDTQELQKGELFSLGMDYDEGRVLTPDEKLQEFLPSAATSATDPEQYKRYIQVEINKLIGVAEGMNQAKEETKAGVAREVEAAGIPREFFDDIQQTTGRRDDFFAMSKADEPYEGLPRRADSAGVIQYQVDKGTGRLQRTDLGKVRRPYTWEVLNEQFSSDILRQSTDDSCISAVGQMLSNGRIKGFVPWQR